MALLLEYVTYVSDFCYIPTHKRCFKLFMFLLYNNISGSSGTAIELNN